MGDKDRLGGLRSGQAMIELSMGLFALAIVVSALCGFAVYIARSLEMQNSLRVKSSSQHDEISVSEFAATYVFGKKTVDIREKAVMPSRVVGK